MAILLIEGPDRVGKTTLVENIVRRDPGRHWMVVKNGKPPAGADWAWSRTHYLMQAEMLHDLHKGGFNVILDRSYVGEAVYAPLYRCSAWNTHFRLPSSDPAAPSSWVRDAVYSEVFRPCETYLQRTGAMLIVLEADAGTLLGREDGASQGVADAARVADESLLFQQAQQASRLHYKARIPVGRMVPLDLWRQVQDTVDAWQRTRTLDAAEAAQG